MLKNSTNKFRTISVNQLPIGYNIWVDFLNINFTQVSNRILKLFALFYESGILHFHKYPLGSQIPLSDKS